MRRRLAGQEPVVAAGVRGDAHLRRPAGGRRSCRTPYGRPRARVQKPSASTAHTIASARAQAWRRRATAQPMASASRTSRSRQYATSRTTLGTPGGRPSSRPRPQVHQDRTSNSAVNEPSASQPDAHRREARVAARGRPASARTRRATPTSPRNGRPRTARPPRKPPGRRAAASRSGAAARAKSGAVGKSRARMTLRPGEGGDPARRTRDRRRSRLRRARPEPRPRSR